MPGMETGQLCLLPGLLKVNYDPSGTDMGICSEMMDKYIHLRDQAMYEFSIHYEGN